MIATFRHRQPEDRPIVDWREDAPKQPEEKIRWLRAEAMALLSMALDLEEQLPYDTPSHSMEDGSGCSVCETCRLEIIADAKRLKY